jgi:hypothetical protein
VSNRVEMKILLHHWVEIKLNLVWWYSNFLWVDVGCTHLCYACEIHAQDLCSGTIQQELAAMEAHEIKRLRGR